MMMGFIIIQRDSNICESVSVCVWGWGVDSKTSPWGATEQEVEEGEDVVGVVRGGRGGTVDRNSWCGESEWDWASCSSLVVVLCFLFLSSSSSSSTSSSSCWPCCCVPLLVFVWIAKDCTVFVSATANEPTNQRLRLCYSERTNVPTSSSLLQRTIQRTNVFVSATGDDPTNEPPNECYVVHIKGLYTNSQGVMCTLGSVAQW